LFAAAVADRKPSDDGIFLTQELEWKVPAFSKIETKIYYSDMVNIAGIRW
jgi:hypothetical protein